EPFTAADVKFTFDYASNPKVGATSRANYAEVERVDIIDDHTVRVVFRNVTLDWSGPFVGATGSIIPRHLFEAYDGDNAQDAPANRMAVGTGPYMVKEFEDQDFLIIGEDVVSTVKITFVPNPHFREPDKPYFSSVELLGGGSAEKVADAVFKTGSIDFGVNVQISGDELDSLERLGL